MATGTEAMERRAAKAKRVHGTPKATGQRVDKGKRAHFHSEAHIALVKEQPCLITRRLGRQYVAAHHADELFPHLISQGLKITDFLSIPLAHEKHQGHTDSLHARNSAQWWTDNGYPPERVYRWLRWFLNRHYPSGHPGADYALEQIAIVERRRSQSL